jgi:hypothetical protein
MPTRFYLPSIGGTTVYNYTVSAWTESGGVSRRLMQTSAQAAGEVSAYISSTVTKTTATNPNDDLGFQFISNPLTAQTISNTGFISGVIQAIQSTAATDARAQLIAKVMSNDGVTTRGTLVSFNTSALSNEFDSTTLTNRLFPVGWSGSGAPIASSVTSQNGDRLVIEIGARVFNATTGTTYSLRFGYDPSTSDLLANEVDTASGNPWIEFSQDLLFLDSSTKSDQGSENTLVFVNNLEYAGVHKYESIQGILSEDVNGGNTLGIKYGSNETIILANSQDISGSSHYESILGISSEVLDGGNTSLLGPFRTNNTPLGIGGNITNYVLGAVDTAVGRRSWISTTVDFASAPAPIGSWDVGSLTILAEYQ